MAVSQMGGPAAAALQAYRATQSVGAASSPGLGVGSAGFDDVLQSAIKSAVGQGHAAETQAMQAISGQGNIIDVVSAVSKAELSLQTTLAVRDRVVAAYQDIMRMPI